MPANTSRSKQSQGSVVLATRKPKPPAVRAATKSPRSSGARKKSDVEPAEDETVELGEAPEPSSNGDAASNGHKPARRATAQSMAAKQRDISVSEFFAKNRHLLGFDNPRKALLTTIKEAVDNSLDACEEAG